MAPEAHDARGDSARPQVAGQHVLLLSGAPGVGKTTLMRAVSERLGACPLRGFLTEEIRSGARREGFRLVTFDGRSALIAHSGLPKTYKVGRYGVDVRVLDALAEEALAPEPGAIHLIDEIGKMECLSGSFVAAMRRLLDSEAIVVASIAQRGGGFIAQVKRRSDVELWEVTRAQRDALPEGILQWLSRRADAPLRR